MRPLLLIMLAFIGSRLVYYHLGVRFDPHLLPTQWPCIEVALLRDDLCQSILYLHIQPPLFNLFLGIVLKLFPEHWALAFNITYLLLGLLLSTATFQLMEKLHVPRGMALLLTILFLASPGCVLYENYLFGSSD
jgi:hypothetical protein